MIIKNTSNTSITLSFIPITIPANSEVTVSDTFANHPLLLSILASTTSLVINGVSSTQFSSFIDAFNSANNPNASNPIITQTDLTLTMSEHQSNPIAHHSNTNDPEPNQKEAMSYAESPSGTNPFETTTAVNTKITESMDYHLAHYNHALELTTNELDAIQHSTSPSELNPFTTVTHATGLVNTGIATHTSNATAHHSNVNDPTANEKAALGASDSPAVGNPIITTTAANSLISTHAGIATAHHSNANDPTTNEKAALGASDTPSALNPIITTTAANSLISTHAGIATAHHSNANDPTANEKAAMGASDSPAVGNPFITDTAADSLISTAISTHAGIATAHHSNANDPTANEKAALGASDSPAVGNPIITTTAANSLISTHAGIATAHHSNANDPTANEKAAMGASDSPAVGNPFITDTAADSLISTAISTHAGIATAHHSNANDPTATEKADLGRLPSSEWHDGFLYRQDATTIAFNSHQAGNFIVNGQNLNTLVMTWTVTTATQLITDAGELSGSTPAASTLYYAYLSNDITATCKKALYLSATAPSFSTAAGNNKWVLKTTGNGINFAFVGWVYTDGSIQFTDKYSVASYYNRLTHSDTSITAAPVTALVASTWEDVKSLGSILVPSGWVLQVQYSCTVEADIVGTVIQLGVYNGTSYLGLSKSEALVSEIAQYQGGLFVYQNTSATPTYLAYTLRHNYSDVTDSKSITELTSASILRIPPQMDLMAETGL